MLLHPLVNTTIQFFIPTLTLVAFIEVINGGGPSPPPTAFKRITIQFLHTFTWAFCDNELIFPLWSVVYNFFGQHGQQFTHNIIRISSEIRLVSSLTSSTISFKLSLIIALNAKYGWLYLITICDIVVWLSFQSRKLVFFGKNLIYIWRRLRPPKKQNDYFASFCTYICLQNATIGWGQFGRGCSSGSGSKSTAGLATATAGTLAAKWCIILEALGREYSL